MSSRGCFLLLLLGFTGFLVGCSKPAGPTTTDPDVLYRHYCAECHARAGEPGGPNMGGSKGPDLSHIGSATGMNAEWLTEYISNPQSKRPIVRVMPRFDDKMTPEQIKSLAEWLAAKK